MSLTFYLLSTAPLIGLVAAAVFRSGPARASAATSSTGSQPEPQVATEITRKAG